MSRQTLLLPDLGEGLTEAEIVRWLVSEGEDVRVDQPVVEVETAKSVVEVPTPYAGRVVDRHGREGETLPVGAPLISFDSPSSNGSGSVLVGYGTAENATPGRRLRPRTTTKAAGATAKPPGDTAKAGDTAEAGDTAKAPGVAAMPPAPPAPSATTDGWQRSPLTGFSRAAAANVARSRAEIPEATIWVDVDATSLVELREAGRAPDGDGPGLLSYLAGFVVAALREFPMFNGQFDTARSEIVTSSRINLGIAVQSDRGLVVPVVVGAEAMSLSTLDRAIDEAVDRARQGRVTAEELAAGTFTLNNYGPLGVDGSAAIINYPQVAILGIGRILERPWVVGGEIRPRKIAQLSFVFDHRICDGGTAAGFIRSVADAIEHPVRALARR